MNGPVAMWAERLLVAAGAAALVWCGVFLADGVIAQRVARNSLEATAVLQRPAPPEHLPPSPTLTSAEPALPPVRPVAPAPTRGAAIGELEIPRVHLSAVVLHGSDAQTLRRGPGHVEHTPLPGQTGNVVIAGHRDSFFRPLRNIAVGDDIFLDTPYGEFHYRVTSLKVINPRDVSVMAPTRHDVLTLITCFPFWVFGDAPDRFIVRASMVDDLHPAANTDVAPGHHEGSMPGFEALTAAGDGATAGVEGAPAAEPAPAGVHRIRDDQSLVRQAVERFRVSYNRGLAGDGVAANAWLDFDGCEVSVSGDTSTVTCSSAPPRAPEVRRFSLGRTSDGWAIRSVALK